MRKLIAAVAAVVFAAVACGSAAQAAPLSAPQHKAANAFGLVAANLNTDAALCVIDSGVTIDESLREAVIAADTVIADERGGDDRPVEAERHGTRVAQVAAAAALDMRVPGIAPGIKVVSVRADSDDRRFHDPNSAAAVDRCLAYPQVKAINISFGSPASAQPLTAAAVERAVRQGVPVVQSAGNTPGEIDWALPGVVLVGGVDVNGQRCASTDGQVTLTALGCDVYAPQLQPNTALAVSGTSFAAPQVAATIVALRAVRPDMTGEEAVRTVIAAAGGSGGQLNVAAAFSAAAAPLPDMDAAVAAAGRDTGDVANGWFEDAKVTVTARPRGGWTIRVANRPPGAGVFVIRRGVVVASSGVSTLRLRQRPWRRVRVMFSRTVHGVQVNSHPVAVTLPPPAARAERSRSRARRR